MNDKDWLIVGLLIGVLALLNRKVIIPVDASMVAPVTAQVDGTDGSPSEQAADNVGNIAPSIIMPMGDDAYGDILSRRHVN